MIYIIILNYNGQKDLRECLDSIFKQLKYLSYKVVVVDNASTDGSVAMIKNKFPQVKLIKNKKNLGFAEGNNVGIRYALKQKADYILILNNDTIVHRDFLTELVKTANALKADLIGPKINFYQPSNLVWAAGGKVNIFLGQTKHLFGEKDERDVPFYPFAVDYLPFAAALIKRKVFQRIGLLDPDYFLLFEDTDFCYRAKKAGFKIMVAPSSKIWHKVSQSFNGIYSPTYLYYLVRNRGLFLRKNAPRYVWFVFIWVYLAFIFKKLIILWLKNKPQKKLASLAIIKGFWDFLWNKKGAR